VVVVVEHQMLMGVEAAEVPVDSVLEPAYLLRLARTTRLPLALGALATQLGQVQHFQQLRLEEEITAAPVVAAQLPL
jgi:hypothetical protein